MKKIDIHNYEEYAIDYMSGTLSKDLDQAFVQFLGENPEIADDFLLFNMESPIKEDDTKVNFTYLRKDINDIIINTSNFEEFCIASAEGDLSSKGEQALKAYIEKQPALQEEFESYQQLKLKIDNHSYPHKDKLKKGSHKALFNWKRTAIITTSAAAIVLFVGLLFSPNDANTAIQELAMTSSFKEFQITPNTPKNQVIAPDKTFKTPVKEIFTRPDKLIAQTTKKTSKTKENVKQIENTAELHKLRSIKPAISPLMSMAPKDLTIINTQNSSRNPLDKNANPPSDFKQLASNYIYTKVLTKSIENINRMAETNLDYKVVENEKGEPVKVVLSTRFGKLNHTLAQR